jgi:hypothetical protein
MGKHHSLIADIALLPMMDRLGKDEATTTA